MTELPPRPEDMSELNSVEVTEPEETQKYHKCNTSSVHGSSSQDGFNAIAFLRKNAFVVLTVVAVALGIGLGFALRQIGLSAKDTRYLTFPGELMIRMLLMLVFPLIISSLISGMTTLDIKTCGKIGIRAFSFYMVTTVIAGFTGITLAVLIQPGKSSRTATVSPAGNADTVQAVDSFLDLIRNMIPSNLVEACFRRHITIYSTNESTWKSLGVIKVNETSGNNERVPVLSTSDGMNTLGLLVFSVTFGLTLGSLGPEGKPLRDFFDSLNKAILRLISIVIWYSPVGTLFLLAGQIVKMTDSEVIGHEVAVFTATVITGLLIHCFLTLPLIYFMITRENPFRLLGGLLEVLTTAFGTSSSSSTLPVTLRCMEENLNMDKQVTRFMLPIGATMNMDGGALYETVAVLFIAQHNNMEFSLAQIIVLSLIVTVTSTGVAGIPQPGMVFMMIVLTSVGLPTEDISLLLIFDWFLDRLRTAVNVLGDCIGVGIVQHLSKHELQSCPV